MCIEVYLDGPFFHRWPMANVESSMIENGSWEDNCQLREKLAAMHYDHFQRFTFPLLSHMKQIQVYMVMESKMNDEDFITELETETEKWVEQLA